MITTPLETPTSMPAPSILGQALRAARKRARLSQQSAAALIGVARTTLLAMETGQRRIKVEELTRLADVYQIQVSSLLAACESNDADAQLLALSDCQKRVILRLTGQQPNAILHKIAMHSFGPIGAFGPAEMQEAIACILLHHLFFLEAETEAQSQWLQETAQGA